MKVTDAPLSGLKIIELKVFHDARGFFVERFNEKSFKEQGLSCGFVQDNHSRSTPRVLRGLHFQNDPAQGKLVGVLRGRIWDVAVDIRPESKTLGQHFSIELSDENGKLLWIPPGFAHGFCVLGDEQADVVYKVDGLYNPKTEGGICWNDKDLNIPWPFSTPMVSEKDARLPSFAEYRQGPRR